MCENTAVGNLASIAARTVIAGISRHEKNRMVNFMTFKDIQIGDTFLFRGIVHRKLERIKEKSRKGHWIFNAVNTEAKRQPRRYFVDGQEVEWR